jgi:hypothetical protein
LVMIDAVSYGPHPVSPSLMAPLVSMLADELAHRACSAEMAAQLGDIYTAVVKKAPNLFQVGYKFEWLPTHRQRVA